MPALPHLVRRFFGHLRAAPLSPAEQDMVRALLRPEEWKLFWALPPADQRHSLDTARRIDAGEHGEWVARAMLLHDVGKRHAPLGPMARSLATIADALRLPLPGSWRRYREHGALGAADLNAAGAEREVVAYAAHHGRRRPPEITPETWSALEAADRV